MLKYQHGLPNTGNELWLDVCFHHLFGHARSWSRDSGRRSRGPVRQPLQTAICFETRNSPCRLCYFPGFVPTHRHDVMLLWSHVFVPSVQLPFSSSFLWFPPFSHTRGWICEVSRVLPARYILFVCTIVLEIQKYIGISPDTHHLSVIGALDHLFMSNHSRMQGGARHVVGQNFPA